MATDVEQHRVTERARGRDRRRWSVARQPDIQQLTDRDQNDERDGDVRSNDAMDARRHCGGSGTDAHERDEDSTGEL